MLTGKALSDSAVIDFFRHYESCLIPSNKQTIELSVCDGDNQVECAPRPATFKIVPSPGVGFTCGRTARKSAKIRSGLILMAPASLGCSCGGGGVVDPDARYRDEYELLNDDQECPSIAVMTQPCTASYIVRLLPTAPAAQPLTRSPLARYTTELGVRV